MPRNNYQTIQKQSLQIDVSHTRLKGQRLLMLHHAPKWDQNKPKVAVYDTFYIKDNIHPGIQGESRGGTNSESISAFPS